MKTSIIVRFDFMATHHWPKAPSEVSFLKKEHRHLFKVSAKIEVSHNDRELEFFIVQSNLKDFVKTWGYQLGSMSCEDMAIKIAMFILYSYGDRKVSVEVSEDGENSAIVEKD